MKTRPADRPDARGLRILLLRAAFNADVVEGLAGGAREALRSMGAREGDVVERSVPGSFELPLAAQAAARSGAFDAIVALGAVIRGETDHYEHIARATTDGLAAVARETGIPVGFGVLTVTREEQARSRSAPGPDNKGGEAARAAVALVQVLRGLREATENGGARAETSKRRARLRRRTGGVRGGLVSPPASRRRLRRRTQ